MTLLAACQQRSADAPSPPSAQAAPASTGQMPSLPATVSDWAKGAVRLDGLGDFHRPITTSAAEAQRYFDQGMRLLWAFNHDESSRSFAQAARLDPNCASCYWGLALTVGPNYNLPLMAETRAKVAAEALALAQQHAAGTGPVERALIEALASRYPNANPLNETNAEPVLAAYAEAMRGVVGRFPDDLDVQTLFAESLMNVRAWKLWTADGRPARGTLEIRAVLERVLARDPYHPGANHYYVHAMEASPHPEAALAAAARLSGLMPAAGHLQHMPAHVLQRVGRYEEAAEANRRGARADAALLARIEPIDYYSAMYSAHNYQFLAYSASMEGRRAETLEAVRNSIHLMPDDQLRAMPALAWWLTQDYAALVRFGLWEQMLQRPAPDSKFDAAAGGYLYGRAVALAATGQVDQAKKTASQLQALAATLAAEAPAGFNTARDLLAIASAEVEARIAAAEHRPDDAIALLREAVAREDRLAYDEPADWFFPVRHLLGAQLLQAGQPASAEAVFREDLRRNPENGWSLFGLAAALRQQHRSDEAAPVERRFRQAWKHSDVKLVSSAF